MKQDQIVLPARSDALPELIGWLSGTPVLQNVETGLLRHIEMAAEEVFLNVAHHGVGNGHKVTEVSIRHSGPELVLSIVDGGTPFNPLEAPEPDTEADLEERKVGGLGLHLLRQISDRQEYERVDEKNRLRIFFTHKASPDLVNLSNGNSFPFVSIFLSLVVVFTAGLMLAALLTALKLESAFMQVQQSQHDLLAREVKGTIERSFGAGLSLESNRSIQIALDRNAQLHDGSVALYVSGLDGAIAYQSAGSSKAPNFDRSGQTAHQMVGDLFFTTVPLSVRNAAIGNLVIAFSAVTAKSESAALQVQLFTAAGLAALLAVPLLGLTVFAAFALMDRRAGWLANAMRDLSHGKSVDSVTSRTPLLAHANRLAKTIRKASPAPGDTG